MLKIENAYLKELRRLRLEDEQKWTNRTNHSQSPKTLSIKDILETLRFPKSTYMYWQKRLDRTASTQIIEEEIQAIRKNINIMAIEGWPKNWNDVDFKWIKRKSSD